MDAGLENLESKLTQLLGLCQSLRAENVTLRQELLQSRAEMQRLQIGLCQSLRAENVTLRQELLQSRAEMQRLQSNVAAVGTRLEAVIERLPGEAT